MTNPPEEFVTDTHFLAQRSLRRGKHRLLLWPDREADGSIDTTTPSKICVRDEMGRLEKVSSMHDPLQCTHSR